MNKTLMISKENIQRNWYLIDANDLILGRLASQISGLLQGTHKPTFTPHQDCGDFVIVVNLQTLAMINDKKWSNKLYYRHSQYPGGLKSVDAKTMFKKDPTWLLQQAVKGMLPKNRLQQLRMKRLFLYADENHPHQGQKPSTFEIKQKIKK